MKIFRRTAHHTWTLNIAEAVRNLMNEFSHQNCWLIPELKLKIEEKIFKVTLSETEASLHSNIVDWTRKLRNILISFSKIESSVTNKDFQVEENCVFIEI